MASMVTRPVPIMRQTYSRFLNFAAVCNALLATYGLVNTVGLPSGQVAVVLGTPPHVPRMSKKLGVLASDAYRLLLLFSLMVRPWSFAELATSEPREILTRLPAA